MKARKENIVFILEAVDVDRAIFGLADLGGKVIAKQDAKFPVGKIKLLSRINAFLGKRKFNFADVSGIIAVTGPGSFTSIRTSLSIVNTWANVKSIPIIGFSRKEFADFEDLTKKGSAKLNKFKHPEIIQPFYGRPPDITQPKKK